MTAHTYSNIIPATSASGYSLPAGTGLVSGDQIAFWFIRFNNVDVSSFMTLTPN